MRKKLRRFKEYKESGIVIEPGTSPFDEIKGQWNAVQFKNENDIVLELACGRGEYTTGFSRLFPDRNFIGVDIKGSRIWAGMCIARDEKLTNVAFLRTQIDHLDRLFNKDEVNEIWIVFPDPRPKKSDERRRLTSPKYLAVYRKVLKKGSWIHLKTDNDGLFQYSIDLLSKQLFVKELQFTQNLYSSEFSEDQFGITTRYEREFSSQGLTIKYLKFRLY